MKVAVLLLLLSPSSIYASSLESIADFYKWVPYENVMAGTKSLDVKVPTEIMTRDPQSVYDFGRFEGQVKRAPAIEALKESVAEDAVVQ